VTSKRKKPTAKTRPARTGARKNVERHLGATEDKVGDRTGSGAGYDQGARSRKPPAKGGVASS